MWEGLSESWHVWLGAWSSLLALSSKLCILVLLSLAPLNEAAKASGDPSMSVGKMELQMPQPCSLNPFADALPQLCSQKGKL